MHSSKVSTRVLPISPPAWSIPHSMVNWDPEGPLYTVPSDPGQEGGGGLGTGVTYTVDVVWAFERPVAAKSSRGETLNNRDIVDKRKTIVG